MLEQRIEEAALNSWPARQQMLLDGWILRFDRGYTKRANSITPVYRASLPMPEKIAVCEHLYQQKQLPVIFRLPSWSADSTELDQLLAAHEYQRIDLTQVLITELTPGPIASDPEIHHISLAEWLPIFCQLSSVRLEQQQAHREILERIVPHPLYAVLYQQDELVACGLGVLEDELFGLFDIVTAPEHRRQGHGTRLVSGMLAWANRQCARHAYLQVLSTNQPALDLYTKLGFHELYHYWYRI